MAVQYYKPHLVKQYLELTDWLVFLDYDLIVKHPHNWYEQYIGTNEYDLVVTDHKEDINNGAFMLRNSQWGRAFAKHWVALSDSGRQTYPFSDNGPFAEATLRFGTRLKRPECRHEFNVCVKDMKDKGAARMKGVAWLHCLGRIKNAVMAGWERNATRTMGRVKFAATASGFNSHSWEDWKAKSGRSSDTYFRDGMFVLHNKYFTKRVPRTSVACPMASATYPFNKQGAYVLSEKGVCNLDEPACRAAHFESTRSAAGAAAGGGERYNSRGHSATSRSCASERELEKVVTTEGTKARKALLHATVDAPPEPPTKVTLGMPGNSESAEAGAQRGGWEDLEDCPAGFSAEALHKKPPTPGSRDSDDKKKKGGEGKGNDKTRQKILNAKKKAASGQHKAA